MNILNTLLTATLFLGYVTLWRVKRRDVLQSDNVDVNVLLKSRRPIQKYFGRMEKVMSSAVLLLIGIHLILKDATPITNYYNALEISLIKIVGAAFGIGGLSLCRIAQVTIGKSWRVGIDEQAKPGLVKHGIYTYIRNPTYTGLFLVVFGIICINPTALYAFWALAFFLMLEFQVRCEEEYLELQYGDEYAEYSNKTKRYCPFIY